MQSAILVLHLMVAIALIGIVLLQRSEGGALGIGGGGGGGGGFGGLMSARGAAGGLVRVTVGLAALFFATSIALSLYGRVSSGGSVLDTLDTGAGGNGAGVELQLPSEGEGGGDGATTTPPPPVTPEGPSVPLSQ